MESLNRNKKIILFDGVCNLCNGAVQFVIRRDHSHQFVFASLQSRVGQQLVLERGINTEELDSIILIEPSVAYYAKSDAALKIGQAFGGGWKLLALLEGIPRPIRDGIYDLVARNRYRWFGKKEACMIPTPELQSRFLDA
ncbi:thiol-disulfide oxidoreductase DCC family protein [Zeaxanthinibacter enoshimensis]|uniref:Putative DCC family thiol-disulfide oxidoreductase YuxK n=1 Tax=Zeaxanthinibacter enoshimensis TaxID=392009 RepID=A0A4R6TP10_9FLAO|nr:thiol-disulfide oxidoreductase DCC family protein [Zeaxanthinibacter enoshimensis]TDQ31335.1 putative DCC family thiol-disulfide oxidoreductase YuxK [Zeaxanthinibacter enoshimensis]